MAREPLGFFHVPKEWDEMTEAEKRVWSEEVVERMKARIARPAQADEDASPS